jgi:hypothetical protein
MSGLIRRFPLVTLMVWASTLLAVLVTLQSAGVLTGAAAHWVDTAAGVLQVILTAYARQHVTPLANPRDALGRPLVTAQLVPRKAPR